MNDSRVTALPGSGGKRKKLQPYKTLWTLKHLAPAALIILIPAAWGVRSLADPPASPPPKEITGVITGSGFTRQVIAIPPCKSDTALAVRGASLIAITKSDLSFSGYFTMVDPSLYTRMNIGSNKIDYNAWKGMGADYLLLTSLHSTGGRLTLEVRLYDVNHAEMVTGKRIRGGAKELRSLGHHISSVVLGYLFGAGAFPTSQILFTSRIGNTEDIFLCDYDGSNIIRLTAMGQLNVTADVSPDGKEMVFTSILKDRQELFLLNRRGKRTKLYGRGEGLNSNPAFSHDGKRIAFCSSRSGNPDIWTIGADGRNLKRITFSWAIDTAPTWSPNDQQIAFTSDRSGSPQIYVMNRDGTNVKRLSPKGSGRCDQPKWSPRGNKLAYATFRNGHYDIAILDFNTGKVSFLTNGEGNSEAPSWSPDGRYIAFSSNRTGSYQIYIARLDGSGVKRITRQPDCYSPCWFKG